MSFSRPQSEQDARPGGRKARPVKPLPEHPTFAWSSQTQVTLFAASSAGETLDAALPTEPLLPNAIDLAARLNSVLSEAIRRAHRAALEPKPSELRTELADFRIACVRLLKRMDLDVNGQPVNGRSRTGASLQGWYRWLVEGMYGLQINAMNARTSDECDVSERELDRATRLALKIVPASFGHDRLAAVEELFAARGAIFNEMERLKTFRMAVIGRALENAGPMLAVLAMLADAAAEQPRSDDKDNFQRAFFKELYLGLARLWLQTFGKIPTGIDSTRRPGGPAFRWHRAVLAHAASACEPLVPEARLAIKVAAEFAPTTLSKRIKQSAHHL